MILRSSAVFAGYRNSCVLRAFYSVSNCSMEDILTVCVKYGYKGNGMYRRHWRKAAEELGINLQKVEIQGYFTPCGCFNFGTVSKHCKTTMKTGTYIVVVKGHVLV